MASIITKVPVPLSVVPCPPSHESKCADKITYSSGFSTPLICASVLNVGTSPKSFEVETILTLGETPLSTILYNIV